jgi:hypothetical protein
MEQWWNDDLQGKTEELGEKPTHINMHDKLRLKLRSDVFTAVKMWTVDFWIMISCSLVGGYQCFRGTYLQGRSEDGGDNFFQNVGNHQHDYMVS